MVDVHSGHGCASLFIALGQAFMAEKIPFPRRPKFLPTVLSQDEVRSLLNPTTSLKHRARVMTLFGAGLRISE